MSVYHNPGVSLGEPSVFVDPSLEIPPVVVDRDLETAPTLNYADYTNALSQAIIASSVYKEAYKLFSADITYGSRYITELEAIPYSNTIVDRDFWDDFTEFFGGTSKFEQAFTDAYNLAMDEIRALVQNYHTFRNSLPAEQIEQQKAAGYNAAVTGQGVGSSVTPTEGNIQTNPSMSSYSNQQLNDGITNFVNFLSLVNGFVNTGATATSLLGNLDIAEEAHDLSLAEKGVVTPQSSLSGNKYVDTIARLSAAKNKAEASVLDSVMNVPIGGDSDPTTPQVTQPLSGFQILKELAKYRLITSIGDSYIGHIRKSTELQYAQLNSTLEQEYLSKNFESMANEGQFTSDFYKSRNGMSEGSTQTSIADSLKNIRSAEDSIASFNAWISDFKKQTFESWGSQLAENPQLAPYLYKGIFDFGMEDTFYHSSVAAMGLKYGLDNAAKAADVVGAFFRGFTGGKVPVKPKGRKSTSTSRGPKGTTITETISEDFY